MICERFRQRRQLSELLMHSTQCRILQIEFRVAPGQLGNRGALLLQLCVMIVARGACHGKLAQARRKLIGLLSDQPIALGDRVIAHLDRFPCAV